MGSSHVDRNGPTKFYPTIREARRGSGPRPTAATARSARAPRFLRVRVCARLAASGSCARENGEARREREGEKRGGSGVIRYTVKATYRARTRESLPRAPPQRKGVVVGVTFRDVSSRDSARVCAVEAARQPLSERVLPRITAYVVIFQIIVLPFFLLCLPSRR